MNAPADHGRSAQRDGELSHDRTLHEIRARLAATGYVALRHVSCFHRDGVVTLEGDVPSFYLKQVAQTAIRDLKAVKQIVNRLRVAEMPRWRREGESAATE